MVGFEIWKNGRKLAVAGLNESGAVSLMLTWVGKDAAAVCGAAPLGEIDGLDLRVGGIDTSGKDGDHSVEWIEDSALHFGDELQIKLVKNVAIDEPMRREPTKSLIAGETGAKFLPCALCGGVRLHSPGTLVSE